jgi:type IV secretory pathway VirJ component
MARRFSMLVLLLGLLPATAGAAADSFKFGRFGTIPIARPAGEPNQVVVLVSGDKGLGEREAAMAKALVASGAMVFEVDTVHYFSTAGKGEGKLFPAVDFEALSQIGQREVGLQAYKQPILVGTGIGASLVYVALAEAPPHTFAGAVSDGFCAVVSSDRLFRRGNGLKTDPNWPKPAIRLLPNAGIENPWMLLDTPGAACAAGKPDNFLRAIGSAKLFPAPAGVAPQEAWRKQLPQAMALLIEKHQKEEAKLAARGALKDLPLIEMPAIPPAKDALGVIITGSGGYVGLDRKMGNQLSLRGVPVVGLSSLAYFWKPRTPEGSAKDLALILDHYLAAWHKSRVILVGYSQGADVIPFMVNGLPPALRAKISVVGLIGPDGGAQFDLRPEGWITDQPQKPELPVGPEVPKLKGIDVICIYGTVEPKSMCKGLAPGVASIVEVPGGHGFEGDAPKLAERFLKHSGLNPDRTDRPANAQQGGKKAGGGKP